MIEKCYGLTDCPKCGKIVAIVISPEWLDAHYLCWGCGTTFMFRIFKDDGEAE